jgi:glycosyltransferase involved in cell wall biosynthesis
MSPSKHPDVLIEALGLLAKNKETFTASFYGDPLPEDAIYYESLKTRVVELGIKDRITFHAGIPNSETPRVYQAHDIFVNCSQSGMFDKTLFEAAACGCLVVASSKDFAALAGENFFFADESESLAARLRQSLLQSQETLPFVRAKMIDMAKQQDLQHLVTELLSSMTNS